MLKALREWRVARVWSVRDLAEQAGVSTKTIVQIEHGRQLPTFRTVRRISEALGVPPAEITEFAETIARRGQHPRAEAELRDEKEGEHGK